MSGGPWGFTATKPFQGESLLVVDGVTVNVRGQIEKTPSLGVSVIGMEDRSMVAQQSFRDSDLPEDPRSYAFKFQQRAVTEEAWWKFKQLASRGRPFWLIDYDYEPETFSAGPELETFRLPRATAASTWASFPATYPHVAFLNDASQTVVTAGTPTTGEIKILGSTVSTPGLVSGDLLVVRYVPAYWVVITGIPQSFAGSNDLTRSIEMVEARSWAA